MVVFHYKWWSPTRHLAGTTPVGDHRRRPYVCGVPAVSLSAPAMVKSIWANPMENVENPMENVGKIYVQWEILWEILWEVLRKSMGKYGRSQGNPMEMENLMLNPMQILLGKWKI